jgi:hypothetical protein
MQKLRDLDRLILVWLYRIIPALLKAISMRKPAFVSY